MKHYDKLLKMGCFSRSDLAGLLGNNETAGALILEYQKKGLIERVRHDLYAVISLETKQPVLSRYQIGCSIFKEAALVNHSAFEFYGYANQVFYEVYISSASRFADFRYNGVLYHRIAPKQRMDIIATGGLRVSSLEQTVIDCIADLDKVTGLEETLRCMTLIPALDEGKLLSILEDRENGFLWQKCGYILEELKEDLSLSEKFFQVCRDHLAGGKRPLVKDAAFPMTWNKKWGLYAPRSLRAIIDKGVGPNDAV